MHRILNLHRQHFWNPESFLKRSLAMFFRFCEWGKFHLWMGKIGFWMEKKIPWVGKKHQNVLKNYRNLRNYAKQSDHVRYKKTIKIEKSSPGSRSEWGKYFPPTHFWMGKISPVRIDFPHCSVSSCSSRLIPSRVGSHPSLVHQLDCINSTGARLIFLKTRVQINVGRCPGPESR